MLVSPTRYITRLWSEAHPEEDDNDLGPLAYDALNRLTQQDTTTRSYNGDGVLIASGATTYTQDLASPLSQVLQLTQGVTTTHELYGVDRLAALGGSTRSWYIADALGSVRQTLDDAGAVNNRSYNGFLRVFVVFR